jgi:hypothetical protein
MGKASQHITPWERFAKVARGEQADRNGLGLVAHTTGCASRTRGNPPPGRHLLEPISNLGFNVLNFSHDLDIATVQSKMPGIVLMVNVPPLSVMARETREETGSWARECVRKTGGQRLILSAGGGASPGALPEAVDGLSHVAMVSESKT